MCTVLLTLGGNPITVNKYIISYILLTATELSLGGSTDKTNKNKNA